MKVASESRNFLLLCLADGSIYSLEAWTGEYQSLTRTAPLLSSSQQPSDDTEAIVPSLDGRLYWRPQTNDLLQELPLTVTGLLEHPVRSCDDSASCGILTAHTTTSLIALSDRGSLLWKTAPDDDLESVKEHEEQKVGEEKDHHHHPTLLLQRKDYWIQHVEAKTGQQSWNVSLGTFSALDFEISEPETEESSSSRLLDDDGIEDKDQLPAIFFSNAGRTVTALDPETRRILWRQDVPTTLSSVFGIAQGQWRSVQVLQQQQGYVSPNQRPPHMFLPSPSSTDYNAEYYENILWSLHHQQMEEHKRKAAAKVKGLPGKTKDYDYDEQQSDERPTHQCYVDVDGSIQCPVRRLELPAPEVGANPQGIFLSWSLVASILSVWLLIIGFILVRWQRRRRKESQAETEDSASQERSGEAKDPTPPPIPSPNPINSTNIPLVRYSRYASEFREQHKLGKGGFGSVFQCENMLDGRLYAIKKVVIAGNAAEYQQLLQRVLREVKTLAVFDHPHIVRYYTAWLEEYDENENDDETSTRLDSSSGTRWLESDSVSDWDVRSNNNNYHHQNYSSRRNRWNATNDLTSLRRRDIRGDDYMIFEDESKENVVTNAASMQSATPADKPAVPDDTATGGLETDTGEADDVVTDLPQDRKRHILYIQMQLCTQRTVTEFLSDPRARQDATGKVDFLKALRLFLQIAEAVEEVHSRGLIHRDLKPSNCFMDETMSVKVGDFGLSRECNDDAEDMDVSSRSYVGHEDHTAGVGTRSYASPEQMNGSDYDASTDVFSLGIILFELLYPMYTGMERSICLGHLRNGSFPKDWDEIPGRSEMNALISSMVNVKPSDRPTACVVAQQIKAILGEYELVSLQSYTNSGDDIVLLRVEAPEDSLRETMQWIRDEAEIVEYGLRVQGDNSSIMEFALQNVPDDLVQKLRLRPDIDKVRQVSATASSSSGRTRSNG